MSRFAGKRCLVTGGAGFIGSNLSIRLLKEGARVKVLDNFVSGRKSNLGDYLNEIDWVEADLRDLESIRRHFTGIDHVFHQAAINSVPRSIESPDLAVGSNVMGTLNVLMAAREAGVGKLVYASSSSVYGGIKEEIKRESMSPDPISPYGISKYAAELLTRNYHQVFGLDTVSLRYFNVYGPRQNPDSPYAAVIPKFLRALLGGHPPTIYGDGRQGRDFTFVEDVVEANLLAALHGKPGEIYNIGRGQISSLQELLEVLYEILGKRVEPVYADWRPGDVFRSRADISRSIDELGYKPRVDLKEGLRKMLEWFKKEEKVPS